MIQYSFKIEKKYRKAYLENDKEAEEFAKFINAEEWNRDTIIIMLRDGNMICQFEINNEDFKNINTSFKNVKIWQSEILKL